MKNIVIIEVPSGVGKDSIFSALIGRNPDKFEKIVSVTDREIRPGEIDGITYKFVTTENFEHMVRTGEIFEFTRRHGTYRGMSKPLIDKILNKGKIALKDCDMIGIRAIKNIYPSNVLTIFINARKEEVERRLLARGETDIAIRLADYNNKIKEIRHFDFVVDNNGTLDEAVQKVQNIIKEECGGYVR